jgi:hypothetical protein
LRLKEKRRLMRLNVSPSGVVDASFTPSASTQSESATTTARSCV